MAIGELQARDNKDSARGQERKEQDSKYKEKYHQLKKIVQDYRI